MPVTSNTRPWIDDGMHNSSSERSNPVENASFWQPTHRRESRTEQLLSEERSDFRVAGRGKSTVDWQK